MEYIIKKPQYEEVVRVEEREVVNRLEAYDEEAIAMGYTPRRKFNNFYSLSKSVVIDKILIGAVKYVQLGDMSTVMVGDKLEIFETGEIVSVREYHHNADGVVIIVTNEKCVNKYDKDKLDNLKMECYRYNEEQLAKFKKEWITELVKYQEQQFEKVRQNNNSSVESVYGIHPPKREGVLNRFFGRFK